jgi:hypothetical protein
MRGTRIVGAAAAAALFLAGCWGGDDDATSRGAVRRLPNVELASSLRRFSSCDELRTWAHDELAPRVSAYGIPDLYGSYGGVGRGGIMVDDVAVPQAAGAEKFAASDTVVSTIAPSTPSFSETNNQVEGVDEPDIVKTDGTHVVAFTNGHLYLVDAASQRVLDSVEMTNGLYDAQLLLAGNRVLLFGTDSFGPMPLASETDASLIAQPNLPGIRIAQFDIDGEKLTASDSYVLDGNLVSARMVGDVVRLVLHADPEARLGFVTPVVATQDAIDNAAAANRAAVESAKGEAFLPEWRKTDADGKVLDGGQLLGCEDAHAPNTYSGFGMVTVLSIDMSDGLAAGIKGRAGAGVMASGQTVYATPTHLYVAAPEWQDWARMSGDELRTASEKHGTDIHRFDISDPKHAEYEMSGHVDGDLLNQFAMDEQDTFLRVATTIGSQWATDDATKSHSQVVVLSPKDGALTEVGKVDGLGKGEAIQSVRFDGDVAYVVTFHQTDPLYTLDLSDPASPRVVGELQLLGYSSYLHPIGDGKLIGVGQDATEGGMRTGTQVALFDVSDPAAPKRIAQAVIPGGWSDAETEHHAFLYWAATGLVAIPVGAADFQGLIGYHVDTGAGTITEQGRVTHSGRGPIANISSGVEIDPTPIAPPDSYNEMIMRSFVIGEKLWTLSQTTLGVSDLATLGQTSLIPLA